MTRSSRFTRAASVVAGAVLAALLAGCGTPTAGTAAVANGRRVTELDVQQATADIQALVGPDQRVAEQQILLFLIVGPDLVQTAAANSVGVSRDEARTTFLSSNKVPAPSDAAIMVLQASRAYRAVGSLPNGQQLLADITKRAESASITVNPRYGALNVSTLTFSSEKQKWIAPTPTSSGAPAPDGQPTPDGQPSPASS